MASRDRSRPGAAESRRPSARWKCPACGRAFAKRGQWHSCRARRPEDHFRGKDPALREIYRVLLTRLRRLGPVRVDAVQTSINLANRYHFGGVTVRRDHLRLGFLSDRPIQDPRIVRRLRLGPRRVGHSVRLRTPADVDGKLMTWLRRAYALRSE